MDIPYVAGLLDGEGSITLARHSTGRSRRPQLSISLHEREPLEEVKGLFGGFVTLRKAATPGRKCMHDWRINSVPAKEALEQLLPYLVIARRRALAKMVLQSWRPAKPGSRTALASRDRLFERMKERNAIRLSAPPEIVPVMAADSDFSYLAGLLDGEGHITPKLQVEVTSTDPEVLSWCAARFGGHVYAQNSAKGNQRPTWSWRRAPSQNWWAAKVASRMQLDRKADLLEAAAGFRRRRGGLPPWEKHNPELADRLVALSKEWTVAHAAGVLDVPYGTACKVVRRATLTSNGST